MNNAFTITEKLRGSFPAERWWRTSVMSAATLLFCIGMAFEAVRSGHSYFSWCVPIFYAVIWDSFHTCEKLLDSMASDNNSPALLKLSSELHSLAGLLNITIVLIGSFCIGWS
jgi:hypothetical protein